jgi:FAD/FMN-containing dehydrogenases
MTSDEHPLTRRRFATAIGAAAVGGWWIPKTHAAPESPTMADFRKTFRGAIVEPGDANFAEAISGNLWNRLLPDRTPDLVVRVADEDDVVRAIRFARTRGMKVVVRGGGHQWSSTSLRAGGLLLDLSGLNRIVSIDTENRRAIVQPVVRNGEIQEAVNAHGLAFPSGHCPHAALSGYILSGGMAWNQGVWGIGADSVDAIEIVTAAGERITATPQDHTDYFWAARGGGFGFFGVAVRYHLRLHPLPRAIHGATCLYTLDDAPAAADWFAAQSRRMPRSVELGFMLVDAPAEFRKQAASRGGKVAFVTAAAFEDSAEAARDALQALKSCPVPALSRREAAPMTFSELFEGSSSRWRPGLRACVETGFSNASLGDIIRAVAPHFEKAPSPSTLIHYTVFTGSDAPTQRADSAFSMFARLSGGPWTMWSDAAGDAANRAWHRECVDRIRPFTSGVYIGGTDPVDRPSNTVEAFVPENWQRLSDLRDKLDPERLFYGYFDGLLASRKTP